MSEMTGDQTVLAAMASAQDCMANAYRQGRADTLAAAAAAIRAFDVDLRLTILPAAHQGEVVVRDLREELAAKVEGLA